MEAGRRGHLPGEHGRAVPARRPGRPPPRPGSGDGTSATWVRTPSASAWASSRRAPWSASTRSPRGRSTVAASVHGPVTWSLERALRSPAPAPRRCRGPARAATSPGGGRRPRCPRARQPPARRLHVGAELGDDSARVRPVIVACTPRPGSSGTCGRSGSSSSTSPTARSKAAVSVPGHRPDSGGGAHAVMWPRTLAAYDARRRSCTTRRPASRRTRPPPVRARSPGRGRAARC